MNRMNFHRQLTQESEKSVQRAHLAKSKIKHNRRTSSHQLTATLKTNVRDLQARYEQEEIDLFQASSAEAAGIVNR
jgi:hypothetical protein